MLLDKDGEAVDGVGDAHHWNYLIKILTEENLFGPLEKEVELLSRVVFQGSELGGVLQYSVGEDSSFENKNDLVMGVESSPAPAG